MDREHLAAAPRTAPVDALLRDRGRGLPGGHLVHRPQLRRPGLNAYWHWDGKRLTRLPVVTFSEVIMPEGHGGLWASAYRH